jgi:hypothetical protein
MSTVLLPPAVHPIAVNRYIILLKMYVAPHLVCSLLSHNQAQYKLMLGNLTVFCTLNVRGQVVVLRYTLHCLFVFLTLQPIVVVFSTVR